MALGITEACGHCGHKPDDVEDKLDGDAVLRLALIRDESQTTKWVVRCASCGAHGPPAPAQIQAVTLWNWREPEEQ